MIVTASETRTGKFAMRILRAALSIPACWLLCLPGVAQDMHELEERHARISVLYDQENYAAVVRQIDAQLKEAPGTPYADSLHSYLYKYGRSHRKLKDARAGVEAAERLYELVKARGHAGNELEALFDLSWIHYDAGELKQCARVDSLAVVVADSDPSVPLRQKGRARQYLAFDHSIIGDHRRSAQWALEALGIYAKADTVPPIQWAESFTAVGVAYWHLGRIRDSEQYYLKALEVLGEGQSQEVLARKASAHGNLGVLWQSAGDIARSKIHYYQNLMLLDQLIANATDQFLRDEATVNRTRTYLNLATVYFESGDVGRARELLEIAWNDRSKVLAADDPQLLTVKERMADLELSYGALDKAEELVSTYLVACEENYGTRSMEYNRACSKLGDIAQRQGDFARADSLFRVSLNAVERNSEASTNMAFALTLQRRARMYTVTGRHAEALSDLLKARQVLVNIYDTTHYKVAHADVLLAEAAFNGGDVHGALAYSRSAIHLLRDRVHALKSSKIPLAFPDPYILPDAILWSVRSQRALAGDRMVDPEWNTALDLAIASLARNKSAVQDEASKLLLIGAQKNLFDLALDVAYETYAHSGSEADVERFLALSEANRSILLKGRLNGFAGLRFAGVPDTVIARERELVGALTIGPGDRAAAADMDRREKEYADFLANLEQEHPQYFHLRYGEPQLTLDAIRKLLLTPDRQLLAYATTAAHLYVLVVGSEGASLERLDRRDLGDAVRTMNDAIAARTIEPYLAAAHEVYTLVIAPVAEQLEAPELLIIPDGDLHVVNFEALLTRASSPADFRNDLLIQRHTIAYLLSATTAVQFAGLARRHTKGTLALAPGFEDAMKQRYLAEVSDSARIDRRFLAYIRQPFAVRTAEKLAGLLSAKVMVGGEATEQHFREEAARHGILHLGTHADMNAASPMYSRLVLSKDGNGMAPDADGYLHAYEIYELDLRAQLAVLTACETGTGVNDGEGVRSLGYAFAYAGCPSLVMSLWKIDEKVSAEIITRFYELLATGMPKHHALHQAKLDHLSTAKDELLLPYYWAGMVLVGEVSPVDTGRRWSWWWGVGLVFLAGLVVFILRRARPRSSEALGRI